ncbi:MAG: isoprenylcysteine carboxylmethyltransferase family protein [Acidobacteriaceae bacterium]|nr:isoprenylcysteine carboxylmethyltransferase family protein [Acidobacteriaceae bacterium]
MTLAFIVFGGPGILAVYVPAWITRWRVPPTPVESRLIAFVLIAIGLVPLADSISRFLREGRGTLSPSHPTENLVMRGLYRYVRNPMYLGVLTLIAGQTVLFRCWELSIYLVCVAVGFHLFVLFYEEPTLRSKYGKAFEQYCRNVPRWIPRLK